MENNSYKLIRSKRKTLALSVTREATLIVRAPIRTPLWYIEGLVREKEEWIKKAILKMRKLPQIAPILPWQNRREYLKHTEAARALVVSRIKELNRAYCFKYRKIAIRNQKSRWGSCSKAGNLNFNYRIIFLEPVVVDYLIVHELCHLKEMNHGKRFWKLVEETIPNYKILRRKLKYTG